MTPAVTADSSSSMPGSSSRFVTAPDGLQLHVRIHGPPDSDMLPVVCLPGLSRTTQDFDALATALCGPVGGGRRVLALDYRGRGRSDYDTDPSRYAIPVEMADVVAVITALSVHPAIVVGTSRGGLIAMALAVAHPRILAGVVLNDIGPVLEPQGLMRIKGYVGKVPLPRSFNEGVGILRRLFGGQFTALADGEWSAWSQRTWREDPDTGRLVSTYDPRLAETLTGISPDHPVPALWSHFDALAGIPLMVVRGANSDLLSAETVKTMRAKRRDIDVIDVAGQGHAPLLAEDAVIKRIAAFLARCDKERGR